MIRSIAIFVVLCIALLVHASCTDSAVPTRVDLQAAVDSYMNPRIFLSEEVL